MHLADRIVVMKNGQVVGTARVGDVSEDDVLGMIILGKCPPGAFRDRERWRRHRKRAGRFPLPPIDQRSPASVVVARAAIVEDRAVGTERYWQ
jgi:ABC-type sugar transport system ATPase subunit